MHEKKRQASGGAPIKLRPHHLLDIISSYGHGVEFKPHSYGHAVHTVARMVLSDPETRAEFIIGSDEICVPCKHLRPDGLCGDVVNELDPPISKQAYNDALDERLFPYIGLAPGAVLTVWEFLEMVNKKVPGIETLCTHPKENQGRRREGLVKGLSKLGVRN